MDEKRHYTYQYAYPTGFIADDGTDLSGVIFYIGRGTGNRLHAHESEARNNCICEKCHLIRSVWSQGKEVQIIKSEPLLAEEAILTERKLIKEHSSPYLINVTLNGNKIRIDDRVRSKIKVLGEVLNYCGLEREAFLHYSEMYGLTTVQYRDAKVYLTSDLEKFRRWVNRQKSGGIGYRWSE